MSTGEVAVVGAGPVGLTAALTLALAGTRVTLFAQRDRLGTTSNAATFHPPTLEIFRRLGIHDQIAEVGLRVPTVEFVEFPGERRTTIKLDCLAGVTDFPYRLHVSSQKLCGMLAQRLHGLPNATIKLNRTARISDLTDRQIVFVADGAASDTRAQLGIDFVGHRYPGYVLRLFCDREIFRNRYSNVCYFESTSGARMSLLQMPDHARLVLRSDTPTLTEASIRARLEEFGFGDIVWTHQDSFQASHRLASRNLVGNAVVVGDAAHVTNTKGGMNMNAGIHDAFLIAQAAIGTPSPHAISHAARERYSVARDLLLPRTNTAIESPRRAAQMTQVQQDPASELEFAAKSSMVDMVPSEFWGRSGN